MQQLYNIKNYSVNFAMFFFSLQSLSYHQKPLPARLGSSIFASEIASFNYLI